MCGGASPTRFAGSSTAVSLRVGDAPPHRKLIATGLAVEAGANLWLQSKNPVEFSSSRGRSGRMGRELFAWPGGDGRCSSACVKRGKKRGCVWIRESVCALRSRRCSCDGASPALDTSAATTTPSTAAGPGRLEPSHGDGAAWSRDGLEFNVGLGADACAGRGRRCRQAAKWRRAVREWQPARCRFLRSASRHKGR